MNLNNTIAAISTPPGEGGICVIRLSGGNAFETVAEIFFKDKLRKQQLDIEQTNSHTIHFGYIIDDNGNLIDEVLISIFKSPNSYTGEDVIEISSHGGTFVSRKILSLLFSKKVVHAEAGEFTLRAFLNGKIDLSQAEAVSDLIKSKTDAAHSSSVKQLEGSLSDFVKATRQDIINIVSLVELELDFAEEGLEFIKKNEIKLKIENLISRIKNIIESYIAGRVIREGVNLVIAGKPNSGKSSLFNYLLKTNRAIVSSIEGTTRDYIQESLVINGILFNITDTAGLRKSDEEIESEGIRRSHKKIDEADLLIYLVDSSASKEELEEEVENFKNSYEDNNSILVYSKMDLGKNTADGTNLYISLLKDDSIEALKSAMTEKIKQKEITPAAGEIILTNLRHKICLENVVAALQDAVTTIDNEMSGEYISVDLRNSLKHLGEITGEVTNDEILNNIFRNFCIGK